MDLSEYEQSSSTKVLVYGPPKQGKTALVGKLAQRYKLHWLDLENGVKTLLNPMMLAPQYRKNVNVVNIPDHRLYPVAIDTIRAVFRGKETKICYDHGKVDCPLCKPKADARWSVVDLSKFTQDDILVIDSLSQLSNSAMNKVTLRAISAPNGEEYKRTYDDYAQQGALLEQVLSAIQVLNINICVISHEVESEMTDGKDKIVPAAGTRAFSKMAAKYFDEAIYCVVTNKVHRAYNSTTYAASVLTGGRSGVILDDQKNEELSLIPIFSKGK